MHSIVALGTGSPMEPAQPNRGSRLEAVALVDCNNFYVSCERVFNPRLRAKPVVILSNNDGIIISRSNEAKALGVKMGSPLFEVRDLIERHRVIVQSSNYALYFDMCDRVREVLAQFAPIEKYSIDECFLDLSHITPEKLSDYGRSIKQRVEQWTHIPVTVGISETKCLAKLANKLGKKSKKARGVLNLHRSPNRERALAMTPVGDLWGVGGAYQNMLRAAGVHTALDFTRAEEHWVRKKMTVVGARMQMELKGIPCLPLEWVAPPKKQLGIAQGFSVLVESLREMKEAAAFKGSEEAAKARKEKLAIKEMNIWIQTNPFGDGPQYSDVIPIVFPAATQDTSTLIRAVEGAVERLYKPGYGYKRIGVWATKLEAEDCVQAHLWVRPDQEKRPKLLKLMDQINDEKGRGTVRMASVGIHQRWLTKFEKQSPHYTTKWTNVPVAQCG